MTLCAIKSKLFRTCLYQVLSHAGCYFFILPNTAENRVESVGAFEHLFKVCHSCDIPVSERLVENIRVHEHYVFGCGDREMGVAQGHQTKLVGCSVNKCKQNWNKQNPHLLFFKDFTFETSHWSISQLKYLAL